MPASTALRPKFDLDRIRDFWTDQANEHGTDSAASWSDQPAISLEIEKMLTYLEAGDKVLDIGCSNGHATIEFAARRDVSIHGIDYVPEMIDQARQHHETLPVGLADRVTFDVGDIMQLDNADGEHGGIPENSFDKVIVTRVVINLGSWENQARSLQQAARTVRPGGLLLLSEATIQGLEKLNAFRAEWDLGPIPEPAFNNYLDENLVCEALTDTMDLVEVANFASTYFVGTRVLKPLLAKLTGLESQVANPKMHWNRWFASMPAAGDYGTQKLFVFRRRNSR